MALGVVMAAGGYSAKYRSGDVISGLQPGTTEAKVFHAGARDQGGAVPTVGGRVLCVCARL